METIDIINKLNNELVTRGQGNKAEYDVWYEGHYLGTIVRVGLTYAEYKENQHFKYHGHELCFQAALLRFVTRAERCIGLPITVFIAEQPDILKFTKTLVSAIKDK